MASDLLSLVGRVAAFQRKQDFFKINILNLKITLWERRAFFKEAISMQMMQKRKILPLFEYSNAVIFSFRHSRIYKIIKMFVIHIIQFISKYWIKHANTALNRYTNPINSVKQTYPRIQTSSIIYAVS